MTDYTNTQLDRVCGICGEKFANHQSRTENCPKVGRPNHYHTTAFILKVVKNIKWEYVRKYIDSDSHIAKINSMGRDGWEMCGILGIYIIYKRRIITND